MADRKPGLPSLAYGREDEESKMKISHVIFLKWDTFVACHAANESRLTFPVFSTPWVTTVPEPYHTQWRAGTASFCSVLAQKLLCILDEHNPISWGRKHFQFQNLNSPHLTVTGRRAGSWLTWVNSWQQWFSKCVPKPPAAAPGNVLTCKLPATTCPKLLASPALGVWAWYWVLWPAFQVIVIPTEIWEPLA